MIFVGLANAFYSIITLLLGFVNLPAFPVEFSSNLNEFLNLIFVNGSALITFLVPSSIIRIFIPIVLLFVSFDYLYKLVMWVIKKIPMINIS